jgi:hypothetical protein
VTIEVPMLTLHPAVLRWTLLDGNVTRRPESHYLDFVIDGRPLTHRLAIARGMITPLNRAWLPSVDAAIEELLGRRPTDGLDPGRVSLFVCGQCGDLACGAVTVTLRVKSDGITWSHFAWENGDKPAEPIENAPDSLEFESAHYGDLFAGANARVAALPYDELAHQGRKFLWPGQWGWRLPKGDQ